ncbi:MAG TPA: hypothetical protein VK473_19040 [Terriglobales bacterium]|nr:hypothetical protein [Terriglobales bacterium]
MTTKEDPRSGKPLEEWGERVGRKIGETVSDLEQETERLVAYLNAEVVPAARDHSTRALRTAAQKLAEFADYLDDQKKKQG